MRLADKWTDYELIDASGGERLERWGDIILIRPDPQAFWYKKRKNPLWNDAHAVFTKTESTKGEWTYYKEFDDSWNITYDDLVFKVKPTDFKHTGLFPEQAVNWDFVRDKIRKSKREVSVLNLFAYTGGASVASAKEGAKVCHVDASKAMNNWAKENALLSGVSDDRIRYIADDCEKFVQREIRRGNKYDIIIMDPPSYGRGKKGELWKFEDKISDFLSMSAELLSENPICMIVNSYTTGVSPEYMERLMNDTVVRKVSGEVTSSEEIGLKISETGGNVPCGQTTIWEKI